MKNSSLILMIMLLIGCQYKQADTSADYMASAIPPVNETELISPIEAFRGSELTVSKKKKRKNQKFSSLQGNLVAHSNFIFLEYIDITEDEFDEMEELTDVYPGESSLFHCYKLESEDLVHRYRSLVQSKITLNNFDREQYDCRIIDFVIVNDIFNQPPYVAAVTDMVKDENVYYAWVTDKKPEIEYFELVAEEMGYCCPDEQTTNLAQAYEAYINSDFYYDYESETTEYDDTYTSIDMREFRDKKGNVFVVIQNRLTGGCESLIESKVVVYEKSSTGLNVLAKGSMDRYFIDFIDSNNDGVPEILGGDFASSAIYHIRNQVIRTKTEFSWSSNGCPC